MGSSEKMAAFFEKTTAKQGNADTDTKSIQRLKSLFDPDSFVGLDNLVISRPFSTVFDRPSVEGDGVDIGYGTIGGRLVFAAAQDPDVYGGSIGKAHAMKIVKSIDMAVSAGAPFVFLMSSGGARIEEGVLALEGLGALLSAIVNAKGVIPLLGCVMGPVPGGLAIAAAKFDFLFFCEKCSLLVMNSPSITAAGAGKDCDIESIGKASVHSKKTGLASFVLPDEDTCLDKVRELLEFIPLQSGDTMSFTRDIYQADDANRCEDSLNAMAASFDESGLSVLEILRSVSDGRSILQVTEEYGSDTITAFGKMDGISVGFIASASERMSEAGARKASAFIRFCTSSMIPLVTFTNSEGFTIGCSAEESGIVTAAADMISAFCESDVPRISILVGKAIGTGYLAMNSKMLGSDVVYAWPTSKIAVLKADTAANILFRDQIASAEDPAKFREEKVSAYADEISDPKVAAGYGQIDEIILPSATRPRIISALDMLLSAYPISERQ